ncbi:hypothetical protein AX17_004508 [Amanita inopinata Kibby_2008]|nr:hypothetical protein AX17_004508 [Amanita inopinata Kibby_2008]
MSNLSSQSRLSVDLGVGKGFVTSRSIRQNPPRLQHSPSLPNIWFPPHSGPIPSQIIDSVRSRLQRPSTPPPNMVSQLVQEKARVYADGTSTDTSPSEAAPDTEPVVAGVDKVSSQNKQDKRRYADPDTLHSLLTPPLTPSSSIATRSDSVGTRGSDTQATSSVEEAESEVEASRFLLVSNVARHIHPDILRAAVISSLRDEKIKSLSQGNGDVSPVPQIKKTLPGDIIKGIFVRCQESHGIVMLAFYDVRHAKLVKALLSVRTAGLLAECVGNSSSDEDAKAWLSCRFVTADELVNTIGNSTFLASTDGTFYLTVESEDREGSLDAKAVESADGMGPEGRVALQVPHVDMKDEPRKFNLPMLKKYLESFGDIKSFSPIEFPIFGEKCKDSANTFRVEYSDIRDTDTAYAELNGQTLFGMKLRVFRRKGQNIASHSSAIPGHCVEQWSYPPREERDAATASFDSSEGSQPRFMDDKFWIGPPGQQSRTRERFLYDSPGTNPTGPDTGRNPFTAIVDSLPSTRDDDAPSPTYFYTSNTANAYTNSTARDLNSHALMMNVNYNAANVVDTSNIPRNDSDRAQLQKGENNGEGTQDVKFWERDAQTNAYGLYYPRPDCYYYPSRDPNAANGHSYNVPNPINPSPTVFYPPVQSGMQATNMLYPVSPQTTFPYAYEFENHHLQPAAGVQSWGLDHVMMMAAGNGHLLPPPTAGVPGTTETCYPDAPIPLVAGCPYYPQQMHNSQNYGIPFYSKPPSGQQSTSVHGPSIFVSNARTPTPTTQVSTTSQTGISISREPAAPPERNQLNLARIEDGQDTRTTVMIKNIPNKMSDKDLINFIDKVCPRRIDFLYLRMDFQNGCNVGYAFVNFIHVQDLLTFAKKKLGEKWNMFSSEKVLQMSYANYQGKEALVEKFKNSCIMDEREAWRPKIFYSDGPEQGLPEPFPAPTHLRRKERSSHNRGALYVPGVGSGLQNQLYTHVGPRRHAQQNEEQRSRVADKPPFRNRDSEESSVALMKRCRSSR